MIPKCHLPYIPSAYFASIFTSSHFLLFYILEHHAVFQPTNRHFSTCTSYMYMLASFPMLGPTAIPNAIHLRTTQEAAKLQFAKMGSATIYVTIILSCACISMCSYHRVGRLYM